MWGKCFGLLGLCLFSLTASAIPNADLISNLQARLQVSPKGGKLIKSFSDHSQSYIYDQALAIIALTKHGDQKNARALLEGLKNLQHKDGSLYFSYYMNAESPYPIEGDKRYAGAIAWVAMAAVTYQKEFKSKEFYPFNHKILSYLTTQMKPLELDGKKTFAITFGPSDLKHTKWQEDETVALEHNLDAYSAFSKFTEINHHPEWNQHVTHLHEFIVGMWDQSRSHFWSGANTKTGLINKQELYLDNQTWSLLALDEKTIKKINAKEALGLNCDNFLVEHDGVTGFMDSKPTRRPASTQFVWSEGTAGQILAMKKFNELHNENISCQKTEAHGFLSNIKKMKKSDGGIAYATKTTNPDFTDSSSVAGTAWYYFAANNINPFDL